MNRSVNYLDMLGGSMNLEVSLRPEFTLRQENTNVSGTFVLTVCGSLPRTIHDHIYAANLEYCLW